MAGEWGWRLHWQDFTHHRFGQRKPAPCHQDFTTRADAEAARERLVRSERVVATVAPTPMPRATKAANTRARNEASRLIDPLPVQRRPHAV